MKKNELILKSGDIEWEDFEAKETHSEIPKNYSATTSKFTLKETSL